MKPLLAFLFLLTIQHSFAQGGEACADTSYRMRFSSPGKDFSFYTHCNTVDGGTVMIGKIIDTLDPSSSNVCVIKLNTTGQLAWKTSFQNLPGNRSHFARIMEQSNGDIVVYGYTRALNASNNSEIILIKFSSMGNVIWSKKFGLSNHFNPQDLVHPYYISEGLDHDLLLTIGGEHHLYNISDSVYSIMARINNDGNIVWSKAIINDNNSWWMKPSGIYESGGEIFTFGHIDNTYTSCGYLNVYAMKMDYATGLPTAIKTYCYATIIGNAFQSGGSDEREWFNSIKLLNGRFVLFGKISSFTALNRYGYKLVFNNQLDIEIAKEYHVPNANNARNNLNVLPDGTTHYYYMANGSLYWASMDASEHVARQRKITFNQNDNSIGSFLNFGYKDSQTYNFATNLRSNGIRYSLFTQVQKNDPAIDSCLGTDTSFIGSAPINFSQTTWVWKDIIENPLVSSSLSLVQSDMVIETENLCMQVSRCDFLRIAGPDTLCITNDFVSFTGLKNIDCRKKVLWSVDDPLVDSMYAVNDSTINIRFNQPQTHRTLSLFASANNCTVAKDTAQIILLPGLKSLPPDTVVCGEIQLRLTPGKWGRNYLWQDGSTDSVFMATDAGSYSIRVQTMCGTIFNDTIHISRPVIRLGNDRTACNGDTVILHATPGLNNYQWLGESFVSVSDSVIKIFPSDTIEYIVSAQSANGCIIKDTIRVNILQPVDIDLGADTTFCQGDSLVIYVPASFATYHWNTGSLSNAITVHNSGSYQVTVTDGNGCISADTIHILPLYGNPVVSIKPNKVACLRQTDTLRVASFTNYEWSNGSTESFLSITDPGNYWVRVRDVNGCTGSDTVDISDIIIAPTAFLPRDTIVCEGIMTELKPDQLFHFYQWSTGSVSPFIEVKNTGLYTLQVEDKYGCHGADSILVLHKDCPNKMLFASAFTPNADNLNDRFKPFVQGKLQDYQLIIYNRWGQVVFSTTNFREAWGGKVKGEWQSNGAFVWICHYQFAGEEKKMEKGTVIMIR